MIPRYAHQIVDTQTLLEKPAFALWCEPGTAKSRTVIDAICELYRRGTVGAVVIVCPFQARSVWADPDPVLSEFAKWVAPDVPYTLHEYNDKTDFDRIDYVGLHVIVTNPEFIRRAERLRPLQQWARKRQTMLVVDESWAYKTPNAKQTRQMQRLRACCERVVLLNGTPGEPKEQYSQFRILNPAILNSYNHLAFRAHYCVMGGYLGKQVVGYQNMDEFHARTAPYCVVRKLRDCVDVGPEPRRTQIEVRLTPETWKLYTQMRDETIAWLSEHESVAAFQAGVKTMRLAQITSGFVGGVATHEPRMYELLHEEETDPGNHEIVPSDARCVLPTPPSPLREVGREKLDGLLGWLKDHWSDPKLLVFTRFRPDVERTQKALAGAYPSYEVVKVYGSQDPEERDRAKRLLAPGGVARPAIVVANAQSGGAALNFAAAQLCVFLANDYSYRIRRQAEGRVDRPGQTGHVTFLDILAVGPKGQRTVDHHIVAALRRKEHLEQWTAAQWLKALRAS